MAFGHRRLGFYTALEYVGLVGLKGFLESTGFLSHEEPIKFFEFSGLLGLTGPSVWLDPLGFRAYSVAGFVQ